LPGITKELLIDIIEKGRPISFNSLKTQLATQQIDFDDEELLGIIRALQIEGVIVLRRSNRSNTFLGFLNDFSRMWQVYVALLLSLVETILVIYASNSSPALPLKLSIGIGLLGFLPGYFTSRAVFPEKRLPLLEGTILNVFLSVLISAGTGILLGIGSFFNPASNVLALSLYTDVLALSASYRSYVVEKQAPSTEFGSRQDHAHVLAARDLWAGLGLPPSGGHSLGE